MLWRSYSSLSEAPVAIQFGAHKRVLNDEGIKGAAQDTLPQDSVDYVPDVAGVVGRVVSPAAVAAGCQAGNRAGGHCAVRACNLAGLVFPVSPLWSSLS